MIYKVDLVKDNPEYDKAAQGKHSINVTLLETNGQIILIFTLPLIQSSHEFISHFIIYLLLGYLFY